MCVCVQGRSGGEEGGGMWEKGREVCVGRWVDEEGARVEFEIILNYVLYFELDPYPVVGSRHQQWNS